MKASPINPGKTTVNPHDYEAEEDVRVKRFPLCVPQPIFAKGASGTVALAKWLTTTGSQSYEPTSCKIDKTIFAKIESGKIMSFQGDEKSVAAVTAHYRFVSDKFGIDKDFVHSFHAGIHPACWFPGEIEDDPDRWGNNIFGSPHYLHFHSCGAYPPGEICWMIEDPTIDLDGTPLWDHGRLAIENFENTLATIKNWPELKSQFRL